GPLCRRPPMTTTTRRATARTRPRVTAMRSSASGRRSRTCGWRSTRTAPPTPSSCTPWSWPFRARWSDQEDLVPWRGPEYKGEFPTLGWTVGEWIEEYLIVPDGPRKGQPFRLTDEQWNHLLWTYR